MSKKKSLEQFSESQHELKKFMDAIDDADSMADVDVKINGNTVYSENCKVFERIETNNSHVDIIWDGDKGDGDFKYYHQYTNEYQTFKAYDNILVIDAEDRCGDHIEIEIRKQRRFK